MSPRVRAEQATVSVLHTPSRSAVPEPPLLAPPPQPALPPPPPLPPAPADTLGPAEDPTLADACVPSPPPRLGDCSAAAASAVGGPSKRRSLEEAREAEQRRRSRSAASKQRLKDIECTLSQLEMELNHESESNTKSRAHHRHSSRGSKISEHKLRAIEAHLKQFEWDLSRQETARKRRSSTKAQQLPGGGRKKTSSRKRDSQQQPQQSFQHGLSAVAGAASKHSAPAAGHHRLPHEGPVRSPRHSDSGTSRRSKFVEEKEVAKLRLQEYERNLREAERRENAQRTCAARKIQACVRGMQARSEVRRLLSMKIKKDLERSKSERLRRERSASVRRFREQDLKRSKAESEQRQKQIRAATRIQALVRGFAVRCLTRAAQRKLQEYSRRRSIWEDWKESMAIRRRASTGQQPRRFGDDDDETDPGALSQRLHAMLNQRLSEMSHRRSRQPSARVAVDKAAPGAAATETEELDQARVAQSPGVLADPDSENTLPAPRTTSDAPVVAPAQYDGPPQPDPNTDDCTLLMRAIEEQRAELRRQKLGRKRLKHEAAALRQLLEVGGRSQLCHDCHVKMVDLRTATAALSRLVEALSGGTSFTDVDDTQDGPADGMLVRVREALIGAEHLDPQLGAIAACLAEQPQPLGRGRRSEEVAASPDVPAQSYPQKRRQRTPVPSSVRH